MNAVASTLISDQPPKVLTSELRDALAIVNTAVRQLHEKRWRVIEQELRLGTGKRPLLYVERSELSVPLRATQLAVRPLKNKQHHVGKFGDVDIAWPAGSVS